MNINEHVESTLKLLEKDLGILGEVLFIGAWARYFYGSYFHGVDYYPRLATKDLDILLNTSAKRETKRIDIHQGLINNHFEAEFCQNGLIKYFRGDLEVEFLIPARGEAKIVPVKAFNLTVQELPHLQMLWREPISVNYSDYSVRLPHPIDYAFHKLLISNKRPKKAVYFQDIKDAEEVLLAMNSTASFEKDLKHILNLHLFPKKQLLMIQKSTQHILMPTLREQVLLALSS